MKSVLIGSAFALLLASTPTQRASAQEGVFQPAPSPPHRSITMPRLAQSKSPNGSKCKLSMDCTSGCCVIPLSNSGDLVCGDRTSSVVCND